MFDGEFFKAIWGEKLAAGQVAYDGDKVRFLDVESAHKCPIRFGILLNLTPRDGLAPLPASVGQEGPSCVFHNKNAVVAGFEGLDLRFQRTPYTPAGLLALTAEHRSTVSAGDMKSVIRLLAVLPDHVGWWSGPRSGGTHTFSFSWAGISAEHCR